MYDIVDSIDNRVLYFYSSIDSIDRGIVRFVEELNIRGCHTVASCEGSSCCDAYVDFASYVGQSKVMFVLSSLYGGECLDRVIWRSVYYGENRLLRLIVPSFCRELFSIGVG